MQQPIIRRCQDAQNGGVRVQKASERELTTRGSSGRGVDPTSHPDPQFASLASRASDEQDAQDGSNNFCWWCSFFVKRFRSCDLSMCYTFSIGFRSGENGGSGSLDIWNAEVMTQFSPARWYPTLLSITRISWINRLSERRNGTS